MWRADTDVQTVIDEFTDGVYGKGAPYIRAFIARMCEAVKGYQMTLYDHPDAEYLTDELIDECDELFRKAEKAAKSEEEVRRRIAREHLSVAYLKAVRLEEDSARAEATDVLAQRIRRERLTEIMERVNLEDSFEYMKRSRYAKDRQGRYRMYYIVR